MKHKRGFWRYLIPAEVLTSIGLTGIARNILEKARKSAVDSGDGGRLAAVYAAQASLEKRQGDADRAIELFKKVIEVAPSDEVGIRHCELAMLYIDKKDFNAAAKHFGQGMESLGSNVGQRFKEDIAAKLEECRQQLRQG